jgi:hypothetical protein
LATLLPGGISSAIVESHARIIYVSNNGVEIDGERGPDCLSDAVSVLSSYLPRPIDCVLSNATTLTEKQKAFYMEKRWKKIVADIEMLTGVKVVHASFEADAGGMDAKQLGVLLHDIVQHI